MGSIEQDKKINLSVGDRKVNRNFLSPKTATSALFRWYPLHQCRSIAVLHGRNQFRHAKDHPVQSCMIR